MRVHIRDSSAAPTGLTLVEVLMSMMVAGIGILSVIVLLPLSFVRSVQATNLTNGTILRYNAQSQINQVALQSQSYWQTQSPWQASQAYQLDDGVIIPNLPQVWMKCTTAGTSGTTLPAWILPAAQNFGIGPPPVAQPVDGPPPTAPPTTPGVVWTPQEYNSLNLVYVFPTWQASNVYSVGAIVLAPSGSNGNNRRFVCIAPGTSGTTVPTWNTTVGQPTTDGTVTPVTWQTVDHSHYVIDPVGWNTINAIQNTAPSPPAPPTLAPALGNNSGALGVNDIANGAAIERFPAGIRSGIPAAAQFATLADSWVEQARGAATNPLPAGGTPPAYTSVVLGNTDLTGLLSPPNVVARVVLTDVTGKLSQTRLLTSVTVNAGPTTTVQWAASDPLTGGFVPYFARVEVQENRYTWMLTVLRTAGSGVANVYVTIFFRRSLVATDEQTYQANGLDGVGSPFTVNYPAGQKPFVKKGGFMLDVTDGRWYRVTDIVGDTGTVLSLLVDQTRPQTDIAASGPIFNVVFMRGVVDVYPIGNE